MDLEGLSPAEAGEVDLYLLDPSVEPALEECLSSPCACYCVLKRPGGCLLVLPRAAVAETALITAEEAGYVGLLGPSLATSCKGISLTEAGEWAQVYPPRQVQVRIVDFDAQVCSCLSPLASAALDYAAFDQDDPTLFPLAVEVVAAAVAWLRDRPGVRGAAGYVTAEELPAEAPGAPLGRQAKTRGAERPKKPTLAGLAAQQGILQDLVVNLVDQVQALTDSHAKGAQVSRAQGQADPGAQGPVQVQAQVAKPGLAAPLHQVLPPAPVRPKRLADILGPPPPARAPQTEQHALPIMDDPGEEILPDVMREELQPSSSEPLAQAMLLQAKALSNLVTQLSSGSADQLLDSGGSGSLSTRGTNGRMKIQTELALRDGAFFDKVVTAACRRMDPSSLGDGTGSAGVPGQQGTMTRYLERFGGYSRDRTLGLAQWQCALAMDLLARGEARGAADTIALMMVFIEQTILDGSPDLGWLLTHLPDPPNAVFLERATTPTTTLRPFSPLADQRLLATTLAYVKELDTLTAKKNEIPRPKPSAKTSSTAKADQGSDEATLSRKQLRAQLWAAKKAKGT